MTNYDPQVAKQNSFDLANKMAAVGLTLGVSDMPIFLLGAKTGLTGIIPKEAHLDDEGSDLEYDRQEAWTYQLGFILGKHVRSNPHYDFIQDSK